MASAAARSNGPTRTLKCGPDPGASNTEAVMPLALRSETCVAAWALVLNEFTWTYHTASAGADDGAGLAAGEGVGAAGFGDGVGELVGMGVAGGAVFA